MTTHDVLQTLRFEPARKRELLGRILARSDLILSVSHYNTEQLHGAFSIPDDRVAYVPNGAEDLFFQPAPDHERSRIRADLGLPPKVPYLVSVANFQPRKNLLRLVRAAARITEIASGELGLVLIGAGAPEEANSLRDAAAAAGRRALICMPGYRQGNALRAAYAEATALFFPPCVRASAFPRLRRWLKEPRSHSPTRPPFPKSAARPGGTSTRTTRIPSLPHCGVSWTTVRSDPAAPCWAGRSLPDTTGRRRTIFWFKRSMLGVGGPDGSAPHSPRTLE